MSATVATMDPYAALRRRLIKETELALYIGVSRPELFVRIPTVEVGKGTFDDDVAVGFWRDVLGADALAALAEMTPGDSASVGAG
ncbi:MAG: hypothetical protein ACE5E6_08835 [Phycisphaerae bacterium]